MFIRQFLDQTPPGGPASQAAPHRRAALPCTTRRERDRCTSGTVRWTRPRFREPQAVRSASIVAVGTIPSTRRPSSASRETRASAASCVGAPYSAAWVPAHPTCSAMSHARRRTTASPRRRIDSAWMRASRSRATPAEISPWYAASCRADSVWERKSVGASSSCSARTSMPSLTRWGTAPQSTTNLVMRPPTLAHSRSGSACPTLPWPRRRDPSGAPEAGRDAVLGRLVAGAGAGGEAGDAGQGLVQGGAAALPFRPELEEAGLGDAGPVGPEGGDVAGELAQGALDGGGAGVELGGDLLELFGGDPDAGGGHVAPPGRALTGRSSSTFGGRRPQTNVHSPGTMLSRRSPRPTSGRRSAGAGRRPGRGGPGGGPRGGPPRPPRGGGSAGAVRRPGRWWPGGGPGGGGRPGPTSARRPARDRPSRGWATRHGPGSGQIGR